MDMEYTKQQDYEFSRLYKLSAIQKVKEQEIALTASQEECVALAKRIQVGEVREFRVNVVVGITEEPNTVHVVGVLNATLMLEDKEEPQEITSPIDVFFKPAAVFEENLDGALEGALDIEPYSDKTIDIGEVCVQYLSLELMPYTDLDDFEIEFEKVYSEPRENPFADLEQLKKS